jgi:hypothetical protein
MNTIAIQTEVLLRITTVLMKISGEYQEASEKGE